MGVGSGDRLARGARSASYGPIAVTKKQWDSIFGDEDETKRGSDANTNKNGNAGAKSRKHKKKS